MRAFITCSTLILSTSLAFPQAFYSHCPTGFHGDGFIDWTTLPKPPAAATALQSTTVTATIPVIGVSNLNVTIQLPNVSNTPPGFYSVTNPAVLQLGFAVLPVTFTFSRPVRGVSVDVQTFGRWESSFTLRANVPPSAFPGSAPPGSASSQVQVTNALYPSPGNVTVTPLQIHSPNVDITSVVLSSDINGTEYGGYELINFRVDDGSTPDLSSTVPAAGLKAWFRADQGELNPPQSPGTFIAGAPVTTWKDVSGNGITATVPVGGTAPTTAFNGPNCNGFVSFNGSGQSLTFPLSISGWTGMTVFLVTQAYMDHFYSTESALAWREYAQWGTTLFNPFQTYVLFRFGTQQVNNQPTYRRAVDLGADPTITTAIHNNTVDTLYVDGIQALNLTGRVATISGAGQIATIGGGEGNASVANTYFTGNIGEILVYNRALSDTEQRLVEAYLRSKYGTK